MLDSLRLGETALMPESGETVFVLGSRERPSETTRFPASALSIAVESEQEPTDLEHIQAEITLLREDNARLRVGQAQGPDAGRLIERLRVWVEQRPDGGLRNPEDQGDEIWQILSEAMLMRNLLMDVCAEIGQVVLTLQGRLDSMIPEAGVDQAECDVGRGA